VQDPDRGAIALAERLFVVLGQGAFTATYKYAVLLGLLDLCLENATWTGAAPDVLTTRQLAEKVLELYWPQTRPWPGGTLRQSSGAGGGQAEIVRAVERFRRLCGADRTVSLSAARIARPREFEQLCDYVEWKLIEMPLPRLQTVGGEHMAFLYEIHWTKEVRRNEVRTYQQTGGGPFDNRILLAPNVGRHLVVLNALLRPLLQQRWSTKVAGLNQLDEYELERFLFGAERVSLEVIRQPLRELQDDRCFYCSERFVSARGLTPDVDHFIPWARHPDDGLTNLVVAHQRCNGWKRDFLAAPDHVARWRARSIEPSTTSIQLRDIADRARWPNHPERTLGVARAVYLHLPDDARLWVRSTEFKPASRPALMDALG
jgi:hypothetical protein